MTSGDPVSTSDVRERVLDALWSQWRELGVAAATSRRRLDDVLDPECLIAFTARHGDLDPRLRDESLDWVIAHGSLVSKARLKNVARAWSVETHPLFLEYAATVNSHRALGWPAGRAAPRLFEPRQRSRLDEHGRPALLALRARAAFGVGFGVFFGHEAVAFLAQHLQMLGGNHAL